MVCCCDCISANFGKRSRASHLHSVATVWRLSVRELTARMTSERFCSVQTSQQTNKRPHLDRDTKGLWRVQMFSQSCAFTTIIMMSPAPSLHKCPSKWLVAYAPFLSYKSLLTLQVFSSSQSVHAFPRVDRACIRQHQFKSSFSPLPLFLTQHLLYLLS